MEIVGNENSGQNVSGRSLKTPLGSSMSTPLGHGCPNGSAFFFFQDFEGLTEVFAPGRPPRYPRGRLRDIRPQNLLFGLLFCS